MLCWQLLCVLYLMILTTTLWCAGLVTLQMRLQFYRVTRRLEVIQLGNDTLK